MKCDKCECALTEDEAREYYGRHLCEDCYMDALSPTRTCDPWAVHSAKTLERSGSGGLQVNETQAGILKILDETGGAERHELCERLNLNPADLEREIAALRHMEKVRGEKRDDKVVVRLW